MANIPNKSDGDILYADNLMKLGGTDLTGGTIANSVTETKLGEVLISAGQFSECAIIMAQVQWRGNAAQTGTFKLYSGQSTTFGSNTQRGDTTIAGDPVGTGGSGTQYCNATLTFVLTSEEDWANDNVYIQITGQNGAASATQICECFNIIVLGV